MKKLLFSAALVLSLGLAACGEEKEEKKIEEIETTSAKVVKQEEKPKKLTLEDKSKQFIDENLEGKSIVDFTTALLAEEDKELVDMIVLGHKDGNQSVDDFDLIGRKATASGIIISFTELFSNTYGPSGKKTGLNVEERTDKFYIYMGSKDIENFDIIKYDEFLHRDKDKNQFFLGAYPEEITNFAIIDLDEEADLSIGQQVTIEGTISNYSLTRDYSDVTKIEDFSLLIDFATLK